jgi:hypothetical protein
VLGRDRVPRLRHRLDVEAHVHLDDGIACARGRGGIGRGQRLAGGLRLVRGGRGLGGLQDPLLQRRQLLPQLRLADGGDGRGVERLLQLVGGLGQIGIGQLLGGRQLRGVNGGTGIKACMG